MLNQVRILGLMWMGGGKGEGTFFFKSVKDFKLSLICCLIKEIRLIFPFFLVTLS